MMRQTGGTAVGEISTRSSPFCFAMASAWGGGMMPSCSPVSSMTRISRTRMRSLTRVRSSRRGLLSKAITTSLNHQTSFECLASRFEFRGRLKLGAGGWKLALTRNLFARRRDEIAYRDGSLIAAGPGAHRHGALFRLAVAYHQHVGDLLQLSLSDFISDLFLPLVELHAQTGRLQP